jgi:hypothetical protein
VRDQRRDARTPLVAGRGTRGAAAHRRRGRSAAPLRAPSAPPRPRRRDRPRRRPVDRHQRQLGHSNLGITNVYLQGIDSGEIIETVHARRVPMIPSAPHCGSDRLRSAGAARRAKQHSGPVARHGCSSVGSPRLRALHGTRSGGHRSRRSVAWPFVRRIPQAAEVSLRASYAQLRSIDTAVLRARRDLYGKPPLVAPTPRA